MEVLCGQTCEEPLQGLFVFLSLLIIHNYKKKKTYTEYM